MIVQQVELNSWLLEVNGQKIRPVNDMDSWKLREEEGAVEQEKRGEEKEGEEETEGPKLTGESKYSK